MTNRCDLGKHVVSGPTVLYWCCRDCRDIFAGHHQKITRQKELDRQFRASQRDLDRQAAANRNPYRFLPYYAVTLAFAGFLLAFFF